MLLGGVCCHVRLAQHGVLNTPWRCANRKRSGVRLIEGLPDNARVFVLECSNNSCRTTCSIRAKPEAHPAIYHCGVGKLRISMIVDYYPHVEVFNDAERSGKLSLSIVSHEIRRCRVAQAVLDRAVRCEGSPDRVEA